MLYLDRCFDEMAAAAAALRLGSAQLVFNFFILI